MIAPIGYSGEAFKVKVTYRLRQEARNLQREHFNLTLVEFMERPKLVLG